MELKIARWESKGLRCPDGIVNLKKDGFKRFNFIQMPNGTGKTTYLELIQAALSGSLEGADGTTIGKYYLHSNPSDESFFETDVECNSEKITFKIEFDFDTEACINKSENNNSKVKYITSYAAGGGEQLPGYKPPRNIRRMLHSEFVKLFVFDGEFARKLFDSTESRAFQCLDSICQLNIFDKMVKATNVYYKKLVIETDRSSAKTGAGVTKAVNKKEIYEKKIEELQKILSEGEIELKRIDKEVSNINSEINEDTSLGGNLKKKAQDKKNIVDSLDKEYNKVTQDYFDIIKNPVNLHKKFISSLNTLQENLYRLKIPASATRAFFEELTDEKECICDREMNKESKDAINRNKEKYFDEDRASIYNKLKSDIRDKLNAKDFDVDVLSRKTEEFQKLNDQRAEAETDLQVALEELKMSAPKNLANKMTKREMLIKERGEISKKIEEIRSDIETDVKKTKSIKILKNAIKEQEKIIQEVQSNILLGEDINRIKALCENSKKDIKQGLKKSIINQCNNKLAEIFKGIKKIQIEDIEEHISLYKQAGGSEGQQLTTGILYLSILLGRENCNFFTIFDSPCGPIDQHVRVDLSEPIVTLVKKDGQFITFVQSSERSYFTTTIESAVDENKIFYLTIYDKDRFSEEEIPSLPKDKTVETKNAFFVLDKVFFNNFSPKINKAESNL